MAKNKPRAALQQTRGKHDWRTEMVIRNNLDLYRAARCGVIIALEKSA
jgi:hypothetical protein